jgi:hypothetical protein
MNHQPDSLLVLKGFREVSSFDFRSRYRMAGGVAKFRRSLVLALMAVLVFGTSPGGMAQDSAPTEYQIKAAFVYNFAKFVEWPPGAFASPSSPIVIGVLGQNVFGDNLEKTIAGKAINNRPLQFKMFDSVTAATNCQILFISSSEKDHFDKIIAGLQNTSVLTVSEDAHFIAAGGMINFVIESNKIHFQIDNDVAKKAGLKISSKLLSLAVRSD